MTVAGLSMDHVAGESMATGCIHQHAIDSPAQRLQTFSVLTDTRAAQKSLCAGAKSEMGHRRHLAQGCPPTKGSGACTNRKTHVAAAPASTQVTCSRHKPRHMMFIQHFHSASGCGALIKALHDGFLGYPHPPCRRRRTGSCGGVRLSAAAGCHHSMYTQNTTEKRS